MKTVFLLALVASVASNNTTIDLNGKISFLYSIRHHKSVPDNTVKGDACS